MNKRKEHSQVGQINFVLPIPFWICNIRLARADLNEKIAQSGRNDKRFFIESFARRSPEKKPTTKLDHRIQTIKLKSFIKRNTIFFFQLPSAKESGYFELYRDSPHQYSSWRNVVLPSLYRKTLWWRQKKRRVRKLGIRSSKRVFNSFRGCLFKAIIQLKSI